MELWTDGVYTVAAEDEGDARRVFAEDVGIPERFLNPLRRVDPAQEITVYDEDGDLRPGERCGRCGAACADGHARDCPVGCRTKTAAEWAAEGRGIVCAREQ